MGPLPPRAGAAAPNKWASGIDPAVKGLDQGFRLGNGTCSSAGVCAGKEHDLVSHRAGENDPALARAGPLQSKYRPAHVV
jgi:hypothetical protein